MADWSESEADECDFVGYKLWEKSFFVCYTGNWPSYKQAPYIVGVGESETSEMLGFLERSTSTCHCQPEIQESVISKFGENHVCRMPCRAGVPVEEPLTNKDGVEQTADSSVSKNKGVFWIKEGTSICPSQEIGSSSKVAGFQSNEVEKDFCQLLFDSDTPAGLKTAFVDDDNDQEIDLLCCDWSGISNFEDVDEMFRNCDPTFGQWSNTDGPSWISSSSDKLFGPEDTLTSGFESSTLESKDMNDRSSYCANVRSLPESRTENIADHKQSHWTSQSCELTTNAEQAYNDGGGETKPALTVFAYVNCLDKQPQINIQAQQHNRQFPSHVKGKAIVPYPQLISKQNCFMESDSSSYIHTLNPTAHLENKFLYQNLPEPTLSSTITDWKQSPSSFEVSDHVTNWTSHGTDKLPDSFLKDPVVKLKEIVGKPSIRPVEMANSVTKQHDDIEQDMHSDGGSLNVGSYSTDMVSALGKSSAIPSGFSDELSVKAIIFQQLQDIVDQLDVRKKLCIRDSLFRLARSAEERHSYAAANKESIEWRSGSHGTEALRKFVDYGDMETHTNSIDRSVAHLLFHSAPEITIVSADIMSLESHMAV